MTFVHVLTVGICLNAVYAVIVEAQPPLWTNSRCGRSKYPDAGEDVVVDTFIVGGRDARPHEFPWLVSIRLKSTNRHFCGGIILNERWVMTAAHCMEDRSASSIVLVLGEHDSSAASTTRQFLDVQSIHSHAEFQTTTNQNDISLLRVASDVIFDDYVQPVCAPDRDDLYTHCKSYVAGWGRVSPGVACCPDILQYATLNITTNAYCNDEYWKETVYDDMICAVDNNGGYDSDACQGDSGGPMTVADADGTFRVVGIVSWGVGCASGYPGVYSRVSYFIDWINGVMDGDISRTVVNRSPRMSRQSQLMLVGFTVVGLFELV